MEFSPAHYIFQREHLLLIYVAVCILGFCWMGEQDGEKRAPGDQLQASYTLGDS